MTEYVVLKRTYESGDWRRMPSGAMARSSEDAIRQLVTDDAEGVYVAIPARSWKPLAVAVEQTTRIRVGEAE